MNNIEAIDSLIQQADLQSLNTLAVPAYARYLKYVENIEQLRSALNFAQRENLQTLILGEGSNIVFSGDFSGLVICNRLRGIKVVPQEGNDVLVRVAAGENWHALVQYCVEQGLNGLENLALIPGLVGAAPIQNIGAYGVELKDVFHSLDYMDVKTGRCHSLNKQECQFSYRHSVFKDRLKNRAVVTQLVLSLSTLSRSVLKYPALANRLSNSASPREVFDVVCNLRSAKLPKPGIIPNAGSFFKNPIVSPSKLQELRIEFPDLVAFPFDDQFKLAAAWLIEARGWKEKNHCDVRVHSDQALVITNPARKSGARVLELAYQIQADIRSCFGVDLEIEPVVV